MEKRILYNLVFLCDDFDKQARVLKKLRRLPEGFYDKETRLFLKGVEFSHARNKIADEKSIETYLAFNGNKTDLDDFFWDTDETKASQLNIEDAATFFVKEKEKQANEETLRSALELYEKTGDISVLNSLTFSNQKNKSLVRSIQDVTNSGLKKLENIKDKVELNNVKFSNNFFFMQLILKGLEPGELIIMAARPGVGKTAFALAMLNDFSKQQKKCLFISLEMTGDEISERLLISKTSITRSTIYSQNSFTEERFDQLREAKEELDKQSIRIVDEVPRSFLEIREMVLEAHKEEKIEVLFIDYLGLISSYKDGDNLDTRTTVSKISRECKLLAMELKIPIILLQQVNRNAAAGTRDDSSFKPLQLTDLRDSGTLEQDANKVFLLWNKKPETEEEKRNVIDSKYEVILSIAKNRNGQSNQKVLFEFNHSLQRIKEMEWLTKPSTWVSKND